MDEMHIRQDKTKSIERDLRKKVKQLEHFKIEYDELCTQLSVLDGFIRDETSRHKVTRDMLQAAEKSNQGLLGELAELRMKLKAQCKRENHEHELKKEVQKTVDLLKRREEEVESKAAADNTKYDTLLKEKQRIEEEAHIATQKHKQEIDELMAKQHADYCTAQALEEKIGTLQSEMSMYRNKITALQTEIENTDEYNMAEIAKLQASHQNQLQSLRDEISQQKKSQTYEMQHAHTQLQEFQELDIQNKMLAGELKRTQKELLQLQTQKEEMFMRYEKQKMQMSNEWNQLLLETKETHSREVMQMQAEHKQHIAQIKEQLSQEIEAKELFLHQNKRESEENYKTQLETVRLELEEACRNQKSNLSEKFQQEKEALQMEMDRQILSLEKELAATSQCLKELKVEKRSWKLKIDSELSSLELKLKKEAHEQQQKLQRATRKYEQAKLRASELHEELQITRSYNSLSNHATVTSDIFLQDIKSLEDEIKCLESENKKLQADLTQALAKIIEKDKDLASFKEEVELSKERASIMLQSKEIELRSLEEQVKNCHLNQQDHGKVEGAFQKQQELLKTLVSKFEKEKSRLKRKNQELSETIQAQEEDINRIHLENERLENCNQRDNKELQVVSEKLYELQKWIELDNERQQSLRKYRQQLLKQRTELETELYNEMLSEKTRNLILQQKLGCIS